MDSRPNLSSALKSNAFRTQEPVPPADSIECRRLRLAQLVGQLLAQRWLRERQGQSSNRNESEEPGAGSSRSSYSGTPTSGLP
jgi:hypothetical protein